MPGLCLAEWEVTCGEYREFLRALIAAGGASGTDAAVTARCPRQVAGAPPYGRVQGGRLAEGTRLADDWPIFGVSWEDAQAYGAWRSEREGREVSLPTEAEWERACRGADGRAFPWGDRFSWAWTVGGKSPVHGGRPQPRPVLAAPEDASPFGVRDLVGSVREWCQDEAADLLPGARACRGGAWSYSVTTNFRGAFRNAYAPGVAYTTLGFRVRAVPRTIR